MNSILAKVCRRLSHTAGVGGTQGGFTKRWMTIAATCGLLLGMLSIQSCTSKTKAGPNGGDLVTLDNGKTNAEILANSDTGEAMVHTWKTDLKTPLPIEAKPLTLGSDTNSVRLDPHPLPSDPPGYCSQFYGRAEWMRGGKVNHGWLSSSGNESARHPFDWNRCWSAGREHGRMWSEMGGPGMGMGRNGQGGMRHE